MTYGCGNDACVKCYPFAYRCPNCGADYPQPVPNGEPTPECVACGYGGEEV